MKIENKLKSLNIILPEAANPVGSYLATKITGKLLYISGQISINEKGELIKGKIGKDLDKNEGYKAAQRCGLNIIAQAKKACGGDLDKIKNCIKLPLVFFQLLQLVQPSSIQPTFQPILSLCHSIERFHNPNIHQFHSSSHPK